MNETKRLCKSCNVPYTFVCVIRTYIHTFGVYGCPKCGEVIKV